MNRTEKFVTRLSSALALTLGFSILSASSDANADGGGKPDDSYSELSGLPPRPRTSSLAVADLLLLTDTGYFGPYQPGTEPPKFFKSSLLSLLDMTSPVNLVESYSRKWPVFLKGNTAFIPNPDGIRDTTTPKLPGDQLTDADCGNLTGTYTCVKLQAEEGNNTAATLIVGWNVELAGDVTTNGRSLFIVADSFKANGFKLDTSSTTYLGAPPAPETTGDKAANGRDGRDGGDVVIYAAELDGIHVVAKGLPGEAGLKGADAVGAGRPQDGGDGGRCANGGKAYIQYSVLRGIGPARENWKTERLRDEACIEKCSNDFSCSQNPSIALCDYTTEANNTTCSDGLDNDKDGYLDCADFNCSKNPFVTVCSSPYKYEEASPEACTDGVGLDCDGESCKHRQICGAPPGDPFFAYSDGRYEASDADCSDGKDNDLDGFVDCADYECKFSPLVHVCGSERTIENCLDGIDNDKDGKTDCADPGCRENPYVHLCDYSLPPFALESSPASCSDKKDNDKDGFTDCADYQCQNNPIVKSCGTFENSLSLCSNGTDDDGDGKVDCKDPHCSQNPFFGKLLCQGILSTPNKHVGIANSNLSPDFNGNYHESDATFSLEGADAGEGGLKGSEPATSHVNPRDGKEGQLGCVWGSHETRSMNRRDIDTLRALLSPSQWTVGTALANTSVKQAESSSMKKGGFLYLDDLMRMRGVFEARGLSCTDVNQNQLFADYVLQASICPAAARNLQHLANLSASLNFYGQPQNPKIDPHNTYRAQYKQLKSDLTTASDLVAKFQGMAASADISMVLDTAKLEYTNLGISMSAELQVAYAKEKAAKIQLVTIQNKLDSRKAEMANNKTALAVVNETIADKYTAEKGGFGQFVLDLVSSVASAYGGPIAGKGAQAIMNKLSASFSSVSPPSADSSGAPPASQAEANGFFDDVWTGVKDSAVKAIDSGPVKQKAEAAVGGLKDLLLGDDSSPAPQRSVIVDEVEALLITQDQKVLARESIDLAFDARKAEADSAVATMERQLTQLREAQAYQMAAKIEYYQQNTALLRGYDKMLLAQSMRATAFQILDQLIRSYWQLLQQAEYEKAVYNTDGVSLFTPWTTGSYDYHIANIADLELKLSSLEKLNDDVPRGGSDVFYKKIQPSEIHFATEAEIIYFKSIGMWDLHGVSESNPPLVATAEITGVDLKNDSHFKVQKTNRIDDVRVNILTTQGSPKNVFVVRDTFDTFRVAINPTTGVEYYRDFVLANTSTTASVSPVHYAPLVPCRHAAPACDFAQDGCDGWLRSISAQDYECSISKAEPDTSKPLWWANAFYDRSLIGKWTILIPAEEMPSSGTISGIELSLITAAAAL